MNNLYCAFAVSTNGFGHMLRAGGNGQERETILYDGVLRWEMRGVDISKEGKPTHRAVKTSFGRFPTSPHTHTHSQWAKVTQETVREAQI